MICTVLIPRKALKRICFLNPFTMCNNDCSQSSLTEHQLERHKDLCFVYMHSYGRLCQRAPACQCSHSCNFEAFSSFCVIIHAMLHSASEIMQWGTLINSSGEAAETAHRINVKVPGSSVNQRDSALGTLMTHARRKETARLWEARSKVVPYYDTL
jgi:hypothetical protein